jgi:hypothetical protein
MESGGESSNSRTRTLKDGSTTFQAEFNGPEDPELAVVLVDSLANTSESRDLFRDIEDRIPVNGLSIKGDLAGASSNDVLPISDQADRLSTILEYARDRFSLPRIIFIGRSIGAVTIALHRPTNNQVVLLNPPMDSAFHRHNESDEEMLEFDEPEDIEMESELDPQDQYIIDDRIYLQKELRSLAINSYYELLARRNIVTAIFVGDGPRLSSQQIDKSFKKLFLTNADVNFTGSHRQSILAQMDSQYKLDIAAIIRDRNQDKSL